MPIQKKFAAPALPNATEEYEARLIDKITSVLRLYFTQVDNFLSQLSGNYGGTALGFPSGDFFDTTNQTAAAATTTLITINTADLTNFVSLVSGSQIKVSKAGYYNVQFSIQAVNTGAAVDNMTVWFRKNGTDISQSAGVVGIPAKHGAINGALVFGWDQLFQLAANDYLQLYWITDAGTSSLATFAASGGAPIHPAAPSIGVTIKYVSAVPS
jgi:hypothetical protein